MSEVRSTGSGRANLAGRHRTGPHLGDEKGNKTL